MSRLSLCFMSNLISMKITVMWFLYRIFFLEKLVKFTSNIYWKKFYRIGSRYRWMAILKMQKLEK